jgi:hypothetical protein
MIGEESQDRESEDRNMDCKILPNLQIEIYMPRNSCIKFQPDQQK